jgi:NAD-dependent deacetylase
MKFQDNLLAALRRARHIVAFTGAGVSAESGIPTFRDAMTGLWEQFDPNQLASPEGYTADPELVWGWYEWRRMMVMRAVPNPAHDAITKLYRRSPMLTLVTQNVDDLHERSGTPNPIHLHGSLHSPRCFRCGRSYEFPDGIPDEPDGGRRLQPPLCALCQGPIRPGVVWFGESLPDAAWRQAQEAAMNCDLLLSIGTSSLVWPAAMLPDMARRSGAMIVQVNPDETPLDALADFNLRGKAGEVLPALVAALD